MGAKARGRGDGRRAILAGLMVGTTALASGLPATPAWAQQASTPTMAQLQSERSFDIPAQPLTDALVTFGQQSGTQITVDGTVARNVSSPAVRGTMTSEQALRQLLAGSGLTYTRSGSTVVIERPGQGGDATVLGPIAVEGQVESADGPVDGYVATRSATATKTDSPLIEVPQSLSVVTRDQMNDRNVQTLNDSLRYSAGVQAGDTGDLTTESFSIRGFNSPYLSLYRDGTRQMFRAFDSVVEPYGLERVEILRGPASVLYGQGVPGGIVNIVTKRPRGEEIGEAQLEIGSHDRYQGAFDIGGPVLDDKTLQFRFTALGRKSDTQIDFVPDDRGYVAPSLRWQSAELGTDLTLYASYQRDATSLPDGLPAQGTVLANPNGTIPVSRFTGEPDWSNFDRTSASIAYAFDQKLGDFFSLRQNLRYTYSKYDRNQVQDRGFSDDTLRTIDRRARKAFQTSKLINVDTRLKAEFGPDSFRNEVIAGIDYSWARFTTKMSQGSIAALDIFTPSYGAPVDTPDPLFDDKATGTQTGLYFQDQIKILEDLVIVGGLRKDWARDRLDDRLNSSKSDQKDDAITYRVGGVYLAPYGLAPYASYTTSFVPIFGTDAQGQLFKPETGRQYEVGVKFQPPGYNSFVTLSAYHLVRRNVQTPDPNDIDFLVQTGEVTTRGVEFEAVASLTDNLSLNASYSLLDAEVTKSNDVDLGKRPTGVAKNLASLWADYALKDGPLDGLSFGAGVRYVGNSPGDAENSFTVPSYTLLDAALRYKFGKLQLAINANNLLDKEYVSTCFASTSCYYGQRRTVIGSLTYRW
jgi:iron complex outermembrane receptor protein